jgi:uncharacterized membrane protein required for colicin V production
VVLVLFAFFLLSGWYHGFLNTVFSLGSHILSCGLAFLCRPLLAHWIKSNASLYNMTLYYTEGSEFVESIELSRTNISSISSEQLSGVIEKVELPLPMGERISQNIAKEAFADESIFTLGEYFNQTLVNVFINIVSILILFILIRMLFAFVIHMLDYARKGFPVLQMADGVIGACFGLIRGFLVMYILFLLIPIVLIILPKTGEYLSNSFFGNFFYHSNFLLRMVPGA